MKRDSFIIYTSFYRPIKDALTDEQLGRLFRALFEYNLGDDDSDAAGAAVDADIAMAYGFFVNQMDVDAAKYDKIVEKRSEAGKAGRAKQLRANRANAQFAEQNGQMSPLPSKTGYNDNVNENVNVNVNVDCLTRVPARVDDQPNNQPTNQDFLEILFFRNIRNAEAELCKFVSFYAAHEWSLKGGDTLTGEQRLAKARGWKPEDGKPRFSQPFLQAWRKLYEALPASLRPYALQDKTAERFEGGKTVITCDERVLAWMSSAEGDPASRAAFGPLTAVGTIRFQTNK